MGFWASIITTRALNRLICFHDFTPRKKPFSEINRIDFRVPSVFTEKFDKHQVSPSF